jgi:hypothetical protein
MQTAVIPQRKRLLELAGEWQGTGTMAVAGSSFPLTAHWSCKANVTGYGLLCEVNIAGVPGMEHFIDVEQFGYDDAGQQIHAGTVCNSGEAHHLSGAWTGDVLTVEDDREQFTVTLVSETEIAVQVVNKGGGPVFDLTLQR